MATIIDISPIDKRFFNNTDLLETPGFFEGVERASKFFQYNSLEDFESSWYIIKIFLRYYQWPFLTTADGGRLIRTTFPFKTETDLESAKKIMRCLYK